MEKFEKKSMRTKNVEEEKDMAWQWLFSLLGRISFIKVLGIQVSAKFATLAKNLLLLVCKAKKGRKS